MLKLVHADERSSNILDIMQSCEHVLRKVNEEARNQIIHRQRIKNTLCNNTDMDNLLKVHKEKYSFGNKNTLMIK